MVQTINLNNTGTEIADLDKIIASIAKKPVMLVVTPKYATARRYTYLLNKYAQFGIAMAFFEFPRYSLHFNTQTPENIVKVKEKIQNTLGGQVILEAQYEI